MTSAAELATAVRRAVEDQPYMVTDERPDGFTVHLDVVDQKWWTLLERTSLSSTFEHIVRVDAAAGTYTVTDQTTTLAWEAGVGGGVPHPVLRGGMSFKRGTLVEVEFRKEFGMDDDGNVGAVVDYTFDSRDGNRLIDAEAQRLGLRKRVNNTAKLGIAVAALGLLGAVVTLIALFATGTIG